MRLECELSYIHLPLDTIRNMLRLLETKPERSKTMKRQDQATWLQPEEYCYPRGGMTRKALCVCEDGIKRIITCGIPDTYFSIPAFRVVEGKRLKGYIYSEDGAYLFRAYQN